jgi:REP element-mobilizing transposase RayT
MDAQPQRKNLPHSVPTHVDPDESLFFVSINCLNRGENLLCNDSVGNIVFKSVSHYAQLGKWYPHIVLLMPDHIHLITSFSLRETPMRQIIEPWKGWLCKRTGIQWQRGFFDHRLRNQREVEEKADYILLNPVRANLVEEQAEWPWKRFPPW